MAIEVLCSCGKQLSAPDAAAGRRGKCPQCGNVLVIPQPLPAAAAVELTLPDVPEMASQPPAVEDKLDDGIDDEYRVKPDPSEPPPLPARSVPRVERPPQTCPSCGQSLPAKAKICVPCGINLRTGRSLITSQAIDEEVLYERVDQVVMYLSWLVPFAFFPIASDAYGKFKPYAIRAIAAAIVFVSVVYWVVGLTNGRARFEPFGPWPDLLLWAGGIPNLDLKGFQGEFHWYQLLTNTFLHGGLMHLGGNLVFLLVFGERINALFGQWKTTVMYLFLAVAASLVFLISQRNEVIVPALGASGAIMGLAGMYFVLLPASRVHMIVWLRLGFITGFQRFTKYFVVRGWGVLMFFLAFDVAATLFSWRDGTAHWAHLGGFICGAILALVLLLTKQVNMHGADIVSVLLGRHAWNLLGKPAEQADEL